MLNYLPTLYEDELWYSVIARYQRASGIVSKRALMRDWYGEVKTTSSAYFPQGLRVMEKNLPPGCTLTAEDIVDKHTLFPFFTAFLSESRTHEMRTMMLEGSAKSIENLFGFTATKVKMSPSLRYCPRCFEADMEKHGESWWRRLFQIPGVLYCHIHQVLLKSSSVRTGNWVEYRCADEDVCDTSIKPDSLPAHTTMLNAEYIEIV